RANFDEDLIFTGLWCLDFSYFPLAVYRGDNGCFHLFPLVAVPPARKPIKKVCPREFGLLVSKALGARCVRFNQGGRRCSIRAVFSPEQTRPPNALRTARSLS